MPISIQTPSRLHFGLIDLNGELGRINGGLGVALEKPFWNIICFKSNEIIDLQKQTDSTLSIVRKFDNQFNTNSSDFYFEIKKSIPKHIGLGSNTQFQLAIGLLLSKLHKLNLSIREIAQVVERGGTSGIGVAVFEKGGFILDGGHSFGPGKQTSAFQPSSISNAPPPPIIFQYHPPKEWQFVLITPEGDFGSHGKEEVDLFKDQCPIPSQEVEKLSRLILVKILPSLVEKDIKIFGEGLTEMQTKFNRFGMEKYESGISSEILAYLRKRSVIFGSGISSFGPTIFALTNIEQNAQVVLKEIKENFAEKQFSLIDYSSISRNGAIIKSL